MHLFLQSRLKCMANTQDFDSSNKFNFTKASIFQENILRRIHFHVANAYHEDSCSAPHCLSHQKFTMTIFDQVEKITKCRIFRLTCGLWIMTICYLYKAILKGHKILMRRKAFHCCKVPCMKVIVFSQTRNYITWNHQIAYTCLFT